MANLFYLEQFSHYDSFGEPVHTKLVVYGPSKWVNGEREVTITQRGQTCSICGYWKPESEWSNHECSDKRVECPQCNQLFLPPADNDGTEICGMCAHSQPDEPDW